MNRKILFRGQTRKKGEKVRLDGSPLDSKWVYGGIFQGKVDYSIIYSHGDGKKYSVYSDTAGQYTGLIDKNGKKIFEGDILKWDEKEWGCPFFETVTWNYELFEIRQREWKSFCEVVGNIFDNPELLEENNT